MLTQVTEKAISNLYDAFANVPKPHVIDGCPCCIERKSHQIADRHVLTRKGGLRLNKVA